MKNCILSIFCFVIFVTILSGCSTDPNEKANELYVEASKIMENQQKETHSRSDAIKLYNNAQEKIGVILSKYSSSNIAVALISGQTKIAGLTMGEFQKLEGYLKALVEAERISIIRRQRVKKTIDAAENKILFCAIIVARTIKDTNDKAKALFDIAGEYAKAGQKKKADQVLSQALKVARTIKNADDKAETLVEIAGEYAKVGQKEKTGQLLSQAFETAKTSESTYSKDEALAKIAGKYAAVGQFTQALETAETIETFYKTLALVDIAGEYAKGGQFSQALKVAGTIEATDDKAKALFNIAGEYAEAGQLSQALEVARTIMNAKLKAISLSNIAGRYTVEHKKTTVHLLSKALKVAKTINDGDDRAKAKALVEIAGEYAKAGQKKKAVTLLTQSFEMAKTIGDDYSRSSVLADIAGKYAAVGQFTQALGTVKTIGGKYWKGWKARALYNIAREYAESGQKKKAYKLLSQSFEIARTIGDGHWRGWVWADIAREYAEAGQKKKAEQLLSLVLEMAKTIKGADVKAEVLADIAGKYTEIGYQPSEYDIANLCDIILATNPRVSEW